MPRTILLSILAFALAGCSMGGWLHVSEPSVSPPQKPSLSDHGVILLDGISISLRPENTVGGLLTIGPLVFPVIPIGPIADSNREHLPFWVSVQFEPKDGTFTFNSKATILKIGSESYEPIRASQLLTSFSPNREGFRSIPGHDWRCFAQLVKLLQPVDGSVTTVKQGCIFLEFPIETPSPSTEFSVELNGLRRLEQPVSLPTIMFKAGTKGVFFFLM